MITDKNIAPGAGIGIDKLGFPYIVSGKHTDGSLPKVIWVAKGGADASGATGVSHVGTRDEPFLTAGGSNGALTYTVDGRGDRIILGPGTWRENLDFGSGTGTTGTAGRMNKRDVGIYGSGGAHVGRCQIVGDGTTTGPTIRVRDGYLRGFILSDVEVGSVTAADADRALPLLDLETVDTAATLTATSSDEWATLRNVHLVSDGTATLGLVLTGAQQVVSYGLKVQNVIRGVCLRGSTGNMCDNLKFYDTEFQDNVTFDVGTLNSGVEGQWDTTSGPTNLTNIGFHNVRFLDVGGTPVTNYISHGGGTHVNVVYSDAWFAQAVADDTLLQLAAGDVVLGVCVTTGIIAIVGS